MNAKDLLGLAVITLSNAHKVGTVDEVLFDPEYRQVLAFRVKEGGLLRHDEAVPRGEVTAIGNDAITVSGPSSINRVDRYPALADARTLKDLLGMKVVSEQGTVLGTVGHAQLDAQARMVERYVLDTSLLERPRREEHAILPDQVVRLGQDNIMIVREGPASTPPEHLGEQQQPGAL